MAPPHPHPAALGKVVMTPRIRSIAPLGLRAVLVLALLAATGCVGGAWKQALEENTPAAYYRFMREHGDSKYADQARERLDFLKLQRHPTMAGFEQFKKQYPDSALTEQLRPSLEMPAFEVAQAAGTASAYRAFLEVFANGPLARRAEGDAVYLEAQGYGGNAAQLGAFAARYPESDFSAEAERTLEAVEARRSDPIDRIGLVLSIAEDTPEAVRVRQAIADRIKELTERVGVRLVELPRGVAPGAVQGFPRVRLEVTHVEREVGRNVGAGELVRPAVQGVTQVVLRDGEGGDVIANRRFEIRVEDKAHVPGTSVLFSAVAPKYWEEFFVPVARWRNDRSIRPAIEMGRPVVDIDAVGERVAVLFEDGDFELIGLADPTKPLRLSSYQRGEDFKKWSGIRLIGDRVAIFGEEGLELVRFTNAGLVAEKTWRRGEIGRVLSITALNGQLVLVGAKGMQILDPTTGQIRQVMRRVIESVATAGDNLIFTDGESIYLSSVELLDQNRVIAQMKLGKTFGPNRVRVLDHAAIVTGPGGALVIDVRNPAAPKAVAKLSARSIGEVVDATRVRGRTFLVGERGLQVLNPELTRVEETIDVGDRMRVSVMGRHLVTADEHGLQVVDATPWAEAAVPASPK
jgi:hypothetical protein